jgi:hypothetical protein
MGELIVATLIALVVGVLVAVVVGALVARHLVRRKWRLVRAGVASLGPDGLVNLGMRHGLRVTSALLSSEWRSSQWQRHRMWRAVHGARDAVSHAEAAGSPVGDLPMLQKHLAGAAEDVDRLLSVEGRAGDASVETAARVSEVIAASTRIRQAATSSIAGSAELRCRYVAANADQEASAILAGIESSRR